MTTLKEFFADKEFVWGFVRKHKVAGSQKVRFKKPRFMSEDTTQNDDVFVGVRLKDLTTKPQI
jgi:hypothetical protein